jgi:fused signal recognition particle receptor
MLSFLRRKKPTEPERRLSDEEIAAAFGSPVQGHAAADTAPEHAPGEIAASDARDIPIASLASEADIEAPRASEPGGVAVAMPVAEVALQSMQAAPPIVPASTPDGIAAAAPVDAGAREPHSVEDTPAELPPAAAGRRGWLERLRGNTFTRSITGLFSRNPRLDDDLLDEIETALLTADVGVTATTELVERLRRRMKAREFADANAMLAALRGDLLAMLEPIARPLVIDAGAKPFVLLTVGVNGVGKTTTIGKLARRFKDEGRTLMLAAGDTFRAAAVAQLQAWGERNGVQVIAQGQNADAASVAFDALQAAKARGTEVLIADTAGRLHTQQGLMAELGKIRRVLQKLDASAPHEVLLVIDGTTGQNALSQLRQFHAAVGVTGLVVTKLDGTAKGGVVFALAREFGIPIRFAGIGERPEDLRVFDAAAFVDALLPEALGRG